MWLIRTFWTCTRGDPGSMGWGLKWGAYAALGLTLSPCSLVCTALRGKLGVFSEMEANFKVCDPVQPLSPGHLQPPVHCPTGQLCSCLRLTGRWCCGSFCPACEGGASPKPWGIT